MSNDEDVLRYPLQTLKLALGGAIMFVITLPILGLAIWRVERIVLRGDPAHGVDLIIILALVTCGALAFYGFGFALRGPVGLRIDSKGISGFAAPSLPWSDIQAVDVAQFYRGEGVIVTLRDPNVLLSQTTGWARLKYWRSAKTGQVLINTSHIAARATDIAKVMTNKLTTSRA